MKSLFLTVLTLLLFTGCESNVRYRAELQPNGLVEIEPGLFIKAIVISTGSNYHVVYVYCDNVGKILVDKPISTGYTANKHTYTNTVLSVPKQ